MLGRLIRILFAMTAIAPISVSLAYIYAAHERNIAYACIAIVACIALGVLCFSIVNQAKSKLERLPIVIQKAKSSDKEVIGFFVAYVLPLVFKGESTPELGAWLPTNSTELRRLLRFLDEDYYESPLTQTHFVSNSKRVAD